MPIVIMLIIIIMIIILVTIILIISPSLANNLIQAENSVFWKYLRANFGAVVSRFTADLDGFLLVWVMDGVKVVSGCLGGFIINHGDCR